MSSNKQRRNYNTSTGKVSLDNRLTVVTGFENKVTGEFHKFDGIDLKIYMYILQRYNYINGYRKEKYYESLDRICTAATGTGYRKNSTNRKRIKKLVDIGLLEVETVETTKDGKKKVSFKDGGYKRPVQLEIVLLDYHLVNPALVEFDSEHGTALRKQGKIARTEEMKIKGENRGKNNHALDTYYEILKTHPTCTTTKEIIHIIEQASMTGEYYKDSKLYKRYLGRNTKIVSEETRFSKFSKKVIVPTIEE